MLDLNAILSIVTLVLLALGGYCLLLLRTGGEALVKTTIERSVNTAFQQAQWPAILAQELQKTRGVERQELRFKSYGALWRQLRPLAIYDAAVINKKVVGDLSTALSGWYFSECGGLLLTPQARSFYFALQDLLRITSVDPVEWDADRTVESEEAHRDTYYKDVFRAVLTEGMADQAISGAIGVLDYFSQGAFEDWQDAAPVHGKKWLAGIDRVAARWSQLDARQRFATLQQVGSILRTSLVNDLESRLR
jgi:hypothetical protein